MTEEKTTQELVHETNQDVSWRGGGGDGAAAGKAMPYPDV